jgi:DNA-binding transcriptional MerR regulator
LEDIFSIKQLSEQIGIHGDTILYYEKIGILPQIERNNRGHRVYGLKHKTRLDSIICLKKAGMSLEEIKKYLKLTISERNQMLLEHKKKLEEQMTEVQRIIEIKLKSTQN